jgi:hypothetical protein
LSSAFQKENFGQAINKQTQTFLAVLFCVAVNKSIRFEADCLTIIQLF